MAEKIKLSEIRDKFPMYGDMSDEQLLMGLRKKFYSDIPVAQFIGRIEFDTTRKRLQGEAAEASGPLLSGIGRGMTNVARGLGQAVGLVSRDEVGESRALDAGLMDTTAGQVGNVVGTAATMLPTAMIPGAATYGGAAAIGAGSGLLAPSESTGETLQNAAVGGVAGPAGAAAVRGLGSLLQGGRALVEPFTKKGQEALTARTLQQFASDPRAAAAAARSAGELVPGSQPTLAQATGDAGLAQLERSIMNTPAGMPELATRQAAQRAARLEAVRALAGTAPQREAAVTARSAAASPLYEQATSAVYPIDDTLKELLARPVMKSAMSRATELAANQGRTAPVDAGRITGQGLQDLKMAVDDLLTNPMAGIGKNEANAVKVARGKLVDWMEGANPAFKAADRAFAEKSVPINTMDVAQELMKRMEPSLARYGASTKEHASAYAMALDAAKDSVKKATGINRPMEEMIDADAARILESVARDMGRKVKAEDLGRALGSNTAQNLAAQNLLRRTLGPVGMPQRWSESNVLQTFLAPYTGVAKLGGAEAAVNERLLRAILDPQDAANLLAQANKPSGRMAQELLRRIPATASSTREALYAPVPSADRLAEELRKGR